ncbi:hypothetical protein [Selenihalanaerobacter shriftii]|uniref:Uncharacterized protein n=1 Tax=Selenihalanaerobacter shriftii TaxID=142842 RepID=A0A1T4LYL8_9FIRM|nr:hypothetical protein [Selenihalanaerobacter shriftii]SJZ59810.1 hypothetical protein SAMN02745118_01304 [Selenihalanaerobacter shriftii]
MLHLITEEDIEQAVDYLANTLPKETLEYAYDHIEGSQPNHILFHFGIKDRVKCALKEGDFDWNDDIHDDLWERLTHKAAQQIFKK